MSLISRLSALLRQRKLDHELSDEMRSHLEMRAEDNIASGMAEEDARADATRRFGNETLLREETRNVRIVAWIETVLQDIRFSLRGLRKSPLASAIVVATLAVGIGANTALFSVANTVLMRPLDYPEAGRLVILKSAYLRNPAMMADVSFPDYLDWKDRSNSFQGMSVFTDFEPNVTGRPEPFRIRGERVTADLLATLQVPPLMGRVFQPEDESSRRRVIVLSYGLWQRLGGDPAIVGKTLQLDQEPYLIVGVMPAGFVFPIESDPAELWSLFIADESITAPLHTNRAIRGSQVLARLKPGISLVRAQEEMAAVATQLRQEYPEDDAFTTNVTPWRDMLVEDVRRPILLLVTAVGLVLLLVCVNVSNVTIARTVARRQEIATRMALGASRGRILRQFMTENFVFAGLGGIGGLLIAYGAVPVLKNYGPSGIPRLQQTVVDSRALVFTGVVTIAAAIFLGLAPVFHGFGTSAFALLKTRTAGGVHRRLRSVLIISEVALATVLLLGAGLLIKSFAHVMSVDPGFDPHHLVTMHVSLPRAQYPDAASQRRFCEEVVRRIEALPQVESAGSIFPRPLGNNARFRFEMLDSPPDPKLQLAANYRAVTPDYFRTMRIPVLRGRIFAEQDAATNPPVVVINQSMARRFWPGQDALGRHIVVSDPMHQGVAGAREIVGIVGDVHHFGLERNTEPEMYTPYAQTPWPWLGLVIRSQSPPAVLARAIRKEIQAVDTNQPATDPLTYDSLLAQSVALRRFQTDLLAVFAAMAILLAGGGIYGVMSFLVSQRKQEIGLRMALGCTQRQVLNLVLQDAVSLTGVGVLLGLAGSLLLTRFMTGLLFNVQAHDPLTMVSACLLLMAMGILAGYIPAYRASRVDPIIVLRHE